jgi:DNA invertase Pin-like site-specific DNA recombinase
LGVDFFTRFPCKAHAAGKKPGAHRIAPEREAHIRKLLAEGMGVKAIVAEVGCGVGVVYRIKGDMAEEGG